MNGEFIGLFSFFMIHFHLENLFISVVAVFNTNLCVPFSFEMVLISAEQH